MKRLTLITTLFVFISNYLFAQQWTTSGTTIYNNNSGNVGIGTTAPATTLDVNGAISVKGINVNDTQIISVPADGTYVIASGNRIKGTYTLSFEAANRVQTVVLLANATHYDYNSSLSILSNTYYNYAVVMSNFRYVFNSDNSVVYLVFNIANRNGGSSVTAHYDGTGAYIPSWGGTMPSSPITGGIYPLAITGGNVGIGIANPANKLDVNGTIHSKSVQIDLNGWGDYVFKKDYQLPSLADIKAYIARHQHLPEVPSEKEMIKNGLDVSEMNKLLMKKVEELTLYLIEKDQQDKQKDKLLASLQEQIDEMKQTKPELKQTKPNQK
ncbi:hypothetical protein [Mucilaginibacter sp. 3215]|uniref:hypothetical protein n=1 Tax=Mucilaginibacter sp. 3215 TaxID=3373912 RepID=UPI003D1C9A6B